MKGRVSFWKEPHIQSFILKCDKMSIQALSTIHDLVCGCPPEGLQELNCYNMPTSKETPTISLFYNNGEFISANNVTTKAHPSFV